MLERVWRKGNPLTLLVGMTMCMRICYVHFCCQPTPQLQNYSSLGMVIHQGN
ncbi:hypothetical protein FD754_018231 [Muntiacus muntjak]|uniref:Uncharacterized protein n=1 Tax=Muntiacus muntjak TaxID=9888 RepID=A0A5N3UWZ4_MUNMU|nr:hypothetical protein FD754_018231 [Muntiacus muntjak]